MIQDQNRVAAESQGSRAPSQGQGAEACPLTLEALRTLITDDSPRASDLARSCGYEAHELARRCGCSVRRLEQVFQECDSSPQKWLRHHRLVHEVQLLARLHSKGQLESIKRFACDCGYRHPDHFRRAFKGAFDMPPEAFLQAHGNALRQLGLTNPEPVRLSTR